MSKALEITCPFCAESIRIDQALAEGDYREFVLILARFGRGRGIAHAYIKLFASKPGATMQTATKLRRAREIEKLWLAKSFHIDGRNWPITHEQIIAAMHEVVQSKGQACGFRNHNYLKRVMLTPARKNDIAVERQVEADRRGGLRLEPEPEPQDEAPFEEWPLEELKAFYRKMMANDISRGMEPTKHAAAVLTEAGCDLDAVLAETQGGNDG